MKKVICYLFCMFIFANLVSCSKEAPKKIDPRAQHFKEEYEKAFKSSPTILKDLRTTNELSPLVEIHEIMEPGSRGSLETWGWTSIRCLHESFFFDWYILDTERKKPVIKYTTIDSTLYVVVNQFNTETEGLSTVSFYETSSNDCKHPFGYKESFSSSTYISHIQEIPEGVVIRYNRNNEERFRVITDEGSEDFSYPESANLK